MLVLLVRDELEQELAGARADAVLERLPVDSEPLDSVLNPALRPTHDLGPENTGRGEVKSISELLREAFRKDGPELERNTRQGRDQAPFGLHDARRRQSDGVLQDQSPFDHLGLFVKITGDFRFRGDAFQRLLPHVLARGFISYDAASEGAGECSDGEIIRGRT